MSARMTSIRVPGVNMGIADRGRKTRPEMIARYRKHFEAQLLEAQTALAVFDDDLLVETYTGVFVKENKKVITE